MITRRGFLGMAAGAGALTGVGPATKLTGVILQHGTEKITLEKR